MVKGMNNNVPMPLVYVEYLELLEDLRNPEALYNVIEGRKAIKTGAKGIPVSELFDKFRSKR